MCNHSVLTLLETKLQLAAWNRLARAKKVTFESVKTWHFLSISDTLELICPGSMKGCGEHNHGIGQVLYSDIHG